MSKYLAEVPQAEVIRFTEGGKFKKEVHFFIPQEPITYPEDTRTQNWQHALNVLETLVNKGLSIIATPKQPLRLPSGGCLDVIKDAEGETYIPIEQRDEKPGIRAPGFQNPWLGYPENLEDCLSGNHVKKESNEEAVFSRSYIPVAAKRPNLEGIYTWQQKLLVPLQEIEKETVLATAKKLNLQVAWEDLEIVYDEETTRDIYYLYQEKEKRAKIKCSFTWYPTPDLIQIRRINLPVTMDEVLIYHEASRDILVVREEELKEKVFGDKIKTTRMTTRNGERISIPDEVVVFKPTSSLKSVLNHLGIYPYDWVEETGNLLSNSDFQQLLKEYPTTDPFTLEGMLWEKGKHP